MTNLLDTILLDAKDVERVFAGVVAIHPEYAVETCGWLAPELILDENVRKFWAGILEGKTVFSAAYDAGLGMEIADLMERVPSVLYPQDAANEIAKRAYVAAIGSQTGKLLQALNNKDAETLRMITQAMADERPRMVATLPDTEEIARNYNEMIDAEGVTIKTGWPEFDYYTGGLWRKNLSVIAGRPSMGKTAAGLMVAQNVAGPSRQKVSLHSLEMPAENVWARIAVPKAHTTHMELMSKTASPEQRQAAKEKSLDLGRYYKGHLYIDDRPAQTIDQIFQTVASFEERPDLVIIDHLGLMHHPEKNQVLKLGLLSAGAKAMAKTLDCHVMLLVQLSRDVARRQDKTPQLTDLRESGQIEENADQVIMIHRPDYYLDEEVRRKLPPRPWSITEFWVRKFRDGNRNAMWESKFSERHQWFYPLDWDGREM
jgi:replicative DNA helicase